MLFIKNVLAANIASDEDLQGVISGFSIENLYKVFDAASLWVLVFGVVLGVIAFSFAGIQFLTSRGGRYEAFYGENHRNLRGYRYSVYCGFTGNYCYYRKVFLLA